jgi:hypothetical protein
MKIMFEIGLALVIIFCILTWIYMTRKEVFAGDPRRPKYSIEISMAKDGVRTFKVDLDNMSKEDAEQCLIAFQEKYKGRLTIEDDIDGTNADKPISRN